MKYQLEMTEAETLAVLGLFERSLTTMLTRLGGIKSSASPASDTVEWSKSGDSYTEEEPPPAPAPVPQTESVYAEFDFEGLSGPTPSDTVAPYVPKKAVYPADKNGDGYAAFHDLVVKWAENIGVADAPQPPRTDIMRDFANSRHAYRALGFVQRIGGLTHACDFVVKAQRGCPVHGDAEAERHVVLLATTLSQVGSILFHELSDLYEHRDIYKEKK